MKSGALIYVRPAEWNCLLYKQVTAQGSKKWLFADRNDAQRFADAENLEVTHGDAPTTTPQKADNE